MAAIVGVPIGVMVVASIAAEIFPALCWGAIFLIGGVLPLVAGVAFHFKLPESARFLATQSSR